MALGGNVLRQHVVEFIRGTGIVTDGVVDDTSLNGPWSWQVPDGVAEITLDGCGAGGGGAGGQNTGAARGGGGGGGSGVALNGLRIPVIPNSNLTITLGAAGLGGPAAAPGLSQSGTQGGATDINGIQRSPFAGAYPTLGGVALNSLRLNGGSNGVGSSTAGQGGSGGGGGTSFSGLGLAGNGNGGNTGATPTNGTLGQEIFVTSAFLLYGCSVHAHGGSGAGAASTTPTTNGSAGNNFRNTGGRALNANWFFRGQDTIARGNNDGSVSYGGGGGGGPSPYGQPAEPPDGNQSAGAGFGFGYGGSGGGGNGAGAAGGDGYVRFTYWSMD